MLHVSPALCYRLGSGPSRLRGPTDGGAGGRPHPRLGVSRSHLGVASLRRPGGRSGGMAVKWPRRKAD